MFVANSRCLQCTSPDPTPPLTLADCRLPTAPDFVRALDQSTTVELYKTASPYTCADGYAGAITLTCLQAGTVARQDGSCKPSGCAWLPAVFPGRAGIGCGSEPCGVYVCCSSVMQSAPWPEAYQQVWRSSTTQLQTSPPVWLWTLMPRMRTPATPRLITLEMLPVLCVLVLVSCPLFTPVARQVSLWPWQRVQGCNVT